MSYLFPTIVNSGKILSILGPLISSLIFFGCMTFYDIQSGIDFSPFKDEPIPEDVKPWLEGGEQSRMTASILEAAGNISGSKRRERLHHAMDYIWRNFSSDAWFNSLAFSRTAGEILKDKKLGGCSDFALVQITLFRAVGIPSRMVITANVDWMINSRSNPLSMNEGHSFIEVYLEDKWHLVDTTYRWLFSDYDLNNKSYPHGEYFCKRGRDFWDMNIRNVLDSNKILKNQALKYDGNYETPLYEKFPI